MAGSSIPLKRAKLSLDGEVIENISASDSSDSETDEIQQLSKVVSICPRRPLTEHRNVFHGTFSYDSKLKRSCAVKFPREKHQFEREKRVLEQLGPHRHVINLLKTGHYRDGLIDHFYIVLERCSQLNLHQYIKTATAYNIEWGIRICKQMILGVTFVQEELIVHKDLKPSNILLSHDLQCAKIADFGSSQIVKSFSSAAFCEDMFGTMGYRPPESFGNSHVSLRTDSFSLGATFYFVLSDGKSPFGQSDDLWDYNARKGIVDLSDLRVPNKEITKHLIKAMLHRDRTRRPAMIDISAHPCWRGSEVDFEYDYRFNEILEEPKLNVKNFSDRHTDAGEFMRVLTKLGIAKRLNVERWIGICNKQNCTIQRINHGNPTTTTKVHDYNNDMKTNLFTTVGLGKHIYVLTYKKSVYRLDCASRESKWEQMQEMIYYHGQLPPAVANGNAIYVVAKCGMRISRGTSKFHASTNTWTMLGDKCTATTNAAIVSSGSFIYCIGGAVDEDQTVTNTVERMNVVSGIWRKVASMPTARFDVAATHCNENIFVLGGKTQQLHKLKIVESYNPESNEWTTLRSMTKPRWGPRYRCHELRGDIYVVGGDGSLYGESIERYDHKNQKSNIIAFEDPDIEIWSSAVVTVVMP